MFVIPQLVYSFWTICLLKVSTHLWSKNDKMIHFTPACCCSSVRRFTASPTPSAVCFLLFVLSFKGFGEKIKSGQDAQTLLVLWIFHCLVYFCKRFQDNELVFFLLFYLRRQILAVIVHEWLLCLGSPAWADQRAPSEKRETQVADFVSRKPPGIRPPILRFIHYPSSSWNIQSSTYCTAKIFLWPSWKRFIFLQIQWSLISSIWVWKCDGNGALTQFFKLCHKSKINFA